MHHTIRVITEEHAALSAMLRSVLLLLAQYRRQNVLPDFAALRAMLFYLDEFPEQQHHRKESEILFPKLFHKPARGGCLNLLTLFCTYHRNKPARGWYLNLFP